MRKNLILFLIALIIGSAFLLSQERSLKNKRKTIELDFISSLRFSSGDTYVKIVDPEVESIMLYIYEPGIGYKR